MNSISLKKIAVLTSGGDAPGMNAAIRSIVRTAHHHHVEVVGIENGFSGLVAQQYRPLTCRNVGNIIHTAGTILGSARAPEFSQQTTQNKAFENLVQTGIEGLIVIGGNGSQQGAHAIAKQGFPVVGVASTIDNDLLGTDISIGFGSALTVACEAIDRLRVTARSHHRGFVVEVMGRDCGELALRAGLAGGAEVVLIPEQEPSLAEIVQQLERAKASGKQQSIIVVAEGCKLSGQALHEQLAPLFPIKLITLGHTQRGGAPTPCDRILASRLGEAATINLVNGAHTGCLFGMINGTVAATPYSQVTSGTRTPDFSLLELSSVLSC